MEENTNDCAAAKKRAKRLPLWIRVTIIIISIILVLAATVIIYSADYYKATDDAISAMSGSLTDGNYTVFNGGGNIGFIFYPGGKVEHTAYAPLMRALADNGISSVLVEMPLKLAVLNADAWREAKELLPNVEKWYIGGHSLGGAMAASALDENIFEGLILLAAYPTKEVNIPALCVYGDNDKVMNLDKYNTGLDLFNKSYKEAIIFGANHSGFASYGQQNGDGEAGISGEEQIDITVDEIIDFITNGIYTPSVPSSN